MVYPYMGETTGAMATRERGKVTVTVYMQMCI